MHLRRHIVFCDAQFNVKCYFGQEGNDDDEDQGDGDGDSGDGQQLPSPMCAHPLPVDQV